MNSQIKLIEKELKQRIQNNLSEMEWSLWFNSFTVITISENEIHVGISGPFIKDWIIENYKNKIESILFDLLGKKYSLVLEIQNEINKEETDLIEDDTTVSETDKPIHSVNELNKPVFQKNIPKDNNYTNYKLNKKYVFNNFIVGENNNFAANAAIAVSRNPGTQYNPLLIYGGVGLGKTHLIQAIGNDMLSKDSKKNIIYINAEDFINEFIESIPKKKTNEFKMKYRSADLLLIDDIHFFQGKKQTQEELFHTFNTLYDNDRQIVFTCDRPVSELKEMADRLRSRFTRGMNIDLQPPKYETRLSILKQKLNNEKSKFPNAIIPDDVLDFLAKNIVTNIRDLEASFITLAGYSDLIGKPLTIEIAQDKLKDYLNSPNQINITIDLIMKTVADKYNFTLADVTSKKQNKSIVRARQIGMYIASNITDLSSTEIGSFFSKNHTTVLHSISRIESYLKTDPNLHPEIEQLINKIKENSTNL